MHGLIICKLEEKKYKCRQRKQQMRLQDRAIIIQHVLRAHKEKTKTQYNLTQPTRQEQDFIKARIRTLGAISLIIRKRTKISITFRPKRQTRNIDIREHNLRLWGRIEYVAQKAEMGQTKWHHQVGNCTKEIKHTMCHGIRKHISQNRKERCIPARSRIIEFP